MADGSSPETVREFIRPFNEQDLDAFAAVLRPEVELHSGRGLHRGVPEAQEWATKKPGGVQQRVIPDALLIPPGAGTARGRPSRSRAVGSGRRAGVRPARRRWSGSSPSAADWGADGVPTTAEAKSKKSGTREHGMVDVNAEKAVYRANVVGSMLRPQALVEAREKLRHGSLADTCWSLPPSPARRWRHDSKIGRQKISGEGSGTVYDDQDGIVMQVVDARYGELLGARIVGGRPCDMIADLVAAIASEGGAPEVTQIVHAHPTVSQAVLDAACAVDGWAIHV
jgi:hypothetical protein